MAEPLSPSVRSALTLGVLGLLLVVSAVWGWSAVTEPFPGKAEAPTCVLTDIEEGEKVFPEQVTVSVLNAGTREGLAGRIMTLLEDQGFHAGDRANAPRDADVRRVQIWAEDPKNPAVRLVRSRLGGKVRVFGRDSSAAGVVVVVGDRFRQLVQGPRSVVARADARICSPSVS